MRTFAYTIKDEVGIHARPAGELVKTAGGFRSEITLEADGRKASARKLMGLMALGIRKGQQITVTIEGPDEGEAAAALEEFFRARL